MAKTIILAIICLCNLKNCENVSNSPIISNNTLPVGKYTIENIKGEKETISITSSMNYKPQNLNTDINEVEENIWISEKSNWIIFTKKFPNDSLKIEYFIPKKRYKKEEILEDYYYIWKN